ncbi:hypothetical protein Tco_1379155, partial [Tanacetum coccineum]
MLGKWEKIWEDIPTMYLVRAARQYLLRNLVFGSSQVVIEPVGLFLSHRIAAPEFGHYAKEMQKATRVKGTPRITRKMMLIVNKLIKVQYDTDNNVFANDIQHFNQFESIRSTCAVETDDSNVTPGLPDICDNDIQDDQNDVECDDERVALANLIANLKLDVDENKKIQKQLKKANATLTQELTECKSILAETSKTLGESNSIRDSCLVALQNKQTEFEMYKAFNDRTVDYDKLKHKLNEALGLIA